MSHEYSDVTPILASVFDVCLDGNRLFLKEGEIKVCRSKHPKVGCTSHGYVTPSAPAVASREICTKWRAPKKALPAKCLESEWVTRDYTQPVTIERIEVWEVRGPKPAIRKTETVVVGTSEYSIPACT